MWIFGVYLNHTFFESIIFPASRKHARRSSASRKSMKSCLGHPFYLKTASQQVVCRIRTHSLRFLTPKGSSTYDVTVLGGVSDLWNGWLKWLHTKNFCIWVEFKFIWIFFNQFELNNHKIMENLIVWIRKKNSIAMSDLF